MGIEYTTIPELQGTKGHDWRNLDYLSVIGLEVTLI
jgi:hypothetical protein